MGFSVWEGLRFVLVALPGLFSYFFLSFFFFFGSFAIKIENDELAITGFSDVYICERYTFTSENCPGGLVLLLTKRF